MTFKESVSTCYKNYFNGKGRASRSEFWWFQLYLIIAFFLLAFVLGVIGLSAIVPFLMIAMALPNIALCVRRLHDFDRSGWWFLLSLVPFLGSFVPYIIGLIKGTRGANRFGPDPLGKVRENETQVPYLVGDSSVVTSGGNVSGATNASVEAPMTSPQNHGRIDLTKQQRTASRIDLEKR